MNSLENFKSIIRECSYDNTYKMAFARSLVQLSLTKDLSNENIVITLEEIARLYINYYWDQTIHFDLIQGSNPIKPPRIISLVKELINDYKLDVENNKPMFFHNAEIVLVTRLEKKYNKCIKNVISVLKQDVSYRFIYLNKQVYNNIYLYNQGDNQLIINNSLLKEFNINHRDLFDLIDYRWGLILETYNSSPRINKKIKIIDEKDIKRSNLTKFKKYLDIQNSEHCCFICNKKIESDGLTIDHVIPWSYLYSDDIWNLVYACKSCNSSKNNKLVDQDIINKLNKRNIDLLNLLEIKDLKDKKYSELKLAIDNKYVDKFYISSKL